MLHLNNRLLLSRVPGRQYDLVPDRPGRGAAPRRGAGGVGEAARGRNDDAG